MIYPYCKAEDGKNKRHYVVDAYKNARYRRCWKCGKRFKTVERYVPDILIQKRGI